MKARFQDPFKVIEPRDISGLFLIVNRNLVRSPAQAESGLSGAGADV